MILQDKIIQAFNYFGPMNVTQLRDRLTLINIRVDEKALVHTLNMMEVKRQIQLATGYEHDEKKVYMTKNKP